MICPDCGREYPDGTGQCEDCGTALHWDGGSGAGSGMGKLIPYRNTCALVGYYLGIFSIIPCVGLPLAAAAVPLGIIGLNRYRQHPAIRGRNHAIVAIVGGSIGLLLWGGAFLLMIVGAILGAGAGAG